MVQRVEAGFGQFVGKLLQVAADELAGFVYVRSLCFAGREDV